MIAPSQNPRSTFRFWTASVAGFQPFAIVHTFRFSVHYRTCVFSGEEILIIYVNFSIEFSTVIIWGLVRRWLPLEISWAPPPPSLDQNLLIIITFKNFKTLQLEILWQRGLTHPCLYLFNIKLEEKLQMWISSTKNFQSFLWLCQLVMA